MMTLREACRILSGVHTRPHSEYGVIVQNGPVPRGSEDLYVEAWARVHAFANEQASQEARK